MTDHDDLELGHTSVEEGGPPARSRRGRWMAALATGVVLGGALGYVVLRRETAPGVPTAPAPSSIPLEPQAEPAGAPLVSGADVELPPLAELDPFVRNLVAALSSHPKVAAWLATDRLVENFTVVTLNIADGRTPTGHLRSLAPAARFRAKTSNGAMSIDGRSYRRYDGYADAVAALDPAGTARTYLTLKPRITEAYRQLGHPEDDFDRVLERAIRELLATPVVDGDIALQDEIVSYTFVDPVLEALSPPQKQLLRMGPRNVRLVQAKLRDIAEQLNLQVGRAQRDD